MEIGIAGKTNVGKTTFFSAATLIDAEISGRVFTTIRPNIGISYARVKCRCGELNVKCNPNNSICRNGYRFIPVKLIDIAGLVPDAHLGKGLGNQFLSDIMQASCLIHVIDASGSTDIEGNVCKAGDHDPLEDVEFFEKELDFWIEGILKRNIENIRRKAEATKEKPEKALHGQLSGLGISEDDIKHAMSEAGFVLSGSENLMEFVSFLRKKSKPCIIAANKADVEASERNIKKLGEKGYGIVPCSAASELALRKAAEKGLIEYMPGDSDFRTRDGLNEEQRRGLDYIRKSVLEKYGSTGIQGAINEAAFGLLGMIVVYPVANISRLTDTKGNVLPDAFLVKKGTALKEFASRVHTQFAEKFIGGVGLDRKKVGADHVLKDGEVIEILFEK
ncbi:MAG: redox-regulated ATPase YchF [Candidatus Aenigmarchaeota archaeon]|nr:redox-regulated ATPase YchF [Candidatus Aenigmarchaeota archaeon]